MKNIFKIIYVFVSSLIFSLFYSKHYLSGRCFTKDKNYIGYKWCWKNFWSQKIIGINRHIPFPVSSNIVIGIQDNLIVHPDDINNFQHFGCYYQCWKGKIVLGKGTYIAPNVGIITQNHNMYNLDMHMESKDVILGQECWIGMNSVILPGVILGDKTIVGAGSIVTKSFPQGSVVLVGNPARIIKTLGEESLE